MLSITGELLASGANRLRQEQDGVGVRVELCTVDASFAWSPVEFLPAASVIPPFLDLFRPQKITSNNKLVTVAVDPLPTCQSPPFTLFGGLGALGRRLFVFLFLVLVKRPWAPLPLDGQALTDE